MCSPERFEEVQSNSPATEFEATDLEESNSWPKLHPCHETKAVGRSKKASRGAQGHQPKCMEITGRVGFQVKTKAANTCAQKAPCKQG